MTRDQTPLRTPHAPCVVAYGSGCNDACIRQSLNVLPPETLNRSGFTALITRSWPCAWIVVSIGHHPGPPLPVALNLCAPLGAGESSAAPAQTRDTSALLSQLSGQLPGIDTICPLNCVAHWKIPPSPSTSAELAQSAKSGNRLALRMGIPRPFFIVVASSVSCAHNAGCESISAIFDVF